MSSFNWSQVYNQAKSSLIFVMIKSRDKTTDRAIKTLAEKAKTKSKKDMSLALNAVAHLSTGFAAGHIGDEIVIMTTAHSLDHIYKASIPITAEKIQQLFTVEVICCHYEEAYRNAGSRIDREYGVARVLSVSCETDVMFLAVPRADLKNFGGGSCHEAHTALQLCSTLDDPTNQCLLVSWPAYKPETIALGNIGVSRRVDEISDPNSNEYTMRLLEVYMGSGKGSSGGPLLNRSGQVVGMLHGGHGEAHSYFICAQDLIAFLTRSLRPNNYPPPALGAGACTSLKRPRENRSAGSNVTEELIAACHLQREARSECMSRDFVCSIVDVIRGP